MPTAYERRLLTFYLANVASRLRHDDKAAARLNAWVAESDNLETFDHLPVSRRRRSRSRFCEIVDDASSDDKMSVRDWQRLGKALQDAHSATHSARLDRTARRLRHLAQSTALSRTDIDILELLLRYHSQPVIESMVDEVFRSSPLSLRSPALPALLGVSGNTLRRRLTSDAPLVRSGLVSIDDDGDLTIVSRLRRLVTAPDAADCDVNRLLLGTPSSSELQWTDFDHLAQGRDYIEKMLTGAMRSGESGVNVLLYGPPGTGKTELCKVLAERLGVTLYRIGEADEDGDEPTRRERLQELRLAQRLLARDRSSLLLFDEMEDLLSDSFPGRGLFGRLFSADARSDGSKVFMNRLLRRRPRLLCGS